MTQRDVAPELADIPKLTAWLDANIPSLGDGPLTVGFIHGGTSNVILSLNRGGKTVVLRRPPQVPPPGSEKAIAREARVLTALNQTDVPHPHVYGSCEDPSVIGANFYVMEKVNGWAAELGDLDIINHPPFDKPPYKYSVAYAMVDGLIALANVDYKAVGLEGFGKPEGFHERQAGRWSKQMESYKDLYDYEGRDLPGYLYIKDWLPRHMPRTFKPGIIHGDCGTPNAMFSFDVPCRLEAMIDWELSTIGDPMIDLAWFCLPLIDEYEEFDPATIAVMDPRGYPTRQELARYYASKTGRDIDNFDYYLALAAFKSGCICEYKVAQAAKGILSRETGDFFIRLVAQTFEDGMRVARRNA